MPTKKQTSAILGVIIALMIGGVLIANLLPVGINEMQEDDTYNVTSGEGNEVVVIDGKLNATVTSTTIGSPDTATIELKNPDSGNTATNTIDNGSTVTYTLDGESLNVTLNDVNDSPTPNESSYTVDVPPDFGWSDSSKTLWGLLPLFFVLVPLVVVAGWAMKAF